MEDSLFAILMASGFSRRFGDENKLLVPFRDKPLARHTLDLVLSVRVWERVFFVCNLIAFKPQFQKLAVFLP